MTTDNPLSGFRWWASVASDNPPEETGPQSLEVFVHMGLWRDISTLGRQSQRSRAIPSGCHKGKLQLRTSSFLSFFGEIR